MKKLLGLILTFLSFGLVSSAYLYFDTGFSNSKSLANYPFQQGCEEYLPIMMNNTDAIVAGLQGTMRLHEKMNYPVGDKSAVLGFFDVYDHKTSAFRQVKGLSNTTDGKLTLMLQKDSDLTKGNRLFVGRFKFTPKYVSSNGEYIFTVSIGSDMTLKDDGPNLITRSDQNLYKVFTGVVRQEPCTGDFNAPSITNLKVQGGSALSGSTKITNGTPWILSLNEPNGLTGKTNVPNYYTGGYKQNWTQNINNNTISNQYGVNSGTFKLHISGEGVTSTTITCNTNNVDCTSNGKTWEFEDLNYSVSIPASLLPEFGMEKKITVTGEVCDNTSDYHTTPNCDYGFIATFNNPVPATGKVLSPVSGDVNVLLNPEIKVSLTDDWIGVNTGSIILTFKVQSGAIWEDLVTLTESDFTGGMFSGIETNYELKFNVKDIEVLSGGLPEESKIKIEGSVADKNGTRGNIQGVIFDTMPACDKLQCCEGIDIFISSGAEYTTGYITGTNLTVSGNAEWIEGEDGTGTIVCQTSGLTLYDVRGGEEILTGFIDLSQIDIAGTGIKIEISGDQMILGYLKDDLVITQSYPITDEINNSSTVNFSWTSEGVSNFDWLSGYYINVCSDLDCNNVIKTEFVEGNTTSKPINLDNGEYYWSVYAVDKAGRVTESVYTGAFTLNVSSNIGTTTITQVSPDGVTNPGSLDFEWTGEVGNGGDGTVSGYVVSVYTGDCENKQIPAIQTWHYATSVTGFNWANDLVAGQDYCWGIYAEGTGINGGYQSGTELTMGFKIMSEIEIVVNLDRFSNETWGKLLFYNTGELNHNEPLYSGIIEIGDNGIGVFTGIIPQGYYDVVFKPWQYLSSYITGIYIDPTEQTVINFVLSGVGTTASGFMMVGDMPTSAAAKQDGVVNGSDYSVIFESYCLDEYGKEGKRLTGWKEICDTNRDGSLTTPDASMLLRYLRWCDPSYGVGETCLGVEGGHYEGPFKKDGFGYMDYKLDVNYK